MSARQSGDAGGAGCTARRRAVLRPTRRHRDSLQRLESRPLGNRTGSGLTRRQGRAELTTLALLLWVALSSAPAPAQATAGSSAPEPMGDRQVASATELSQARRLVADGRLEQAIEILERLKAQYPMDLRPYNELAVVHAERGDLPRARALLETAISLDSQYARVYENLQAIYAALAAEAYDRALRVDARAGPTPALASLVGEYADQMPEAADREKPDTRRSAQPWETLALATAPVAESKPYLAPSPPMAATTDREPQTPNAQLAEASALTSTEAIARGAEPVLAKVTSRDTTPQAEGAPSSPPSKAVAETVRAWADAWSRQNVEAYLSFYGHHFVPARGMSRRRWAELRRRRVSSPTFIEVSVHDLLVTLTSADRASARFNQRYRSNVLDSTVTKVLRLSRKNGRWKITRENVD